MIIAHVIPLTQSIDTEVLSYFSARQIPAGTLVTVPLRKREIKALVVHTQSVTNMKSQLRHASYQIRNILHIHDEAIFSEAFLESCDALKGFYATTTGRVIKSLTPTLVSKNLELFSSQKTNSKRGDFHEKILGQSLADRMIYYKTLSREKMLKQESLHIICPTQDHADYVFNEISGHITEHCFILHSGLTAKKLKDSYIQLREKTSTSILVSTAQFLDTYQHNKDTIIIEQESSEYYFTISAPYIDLRYAAYTYAKKLECHIIWADTIIRPETWYKHKNERVELVEPFIKKIFKSQEITIINQNTAQKEKQTDLERIEALSKSSEFQIIDNQIVEYLKKTLEQDNRIFLFVPKKSLAPNIVCRDCGNIARSPETGYPLSLYIRENKKTRIKERILMSQTTGESFPAFDQCQFCRGYNLIQLGIGTQRVEEYLRIKFPAIPTYIVDGNTIKTQKQKNIFKQEYSKEKKAFVIGTQKALSIVNNIDTSLIISLESFFSRPDYAISQKVLNIITSLRENTKDQVIIQSRNILQDFLPLLEDGFYLPYIEKELYMREQYNYPPYRTIFVIKTSIKRDTFKKSYQQMAKLFEEYNPNILTQPGKKKELLELIIIIDQDTKDWNIDFQNPQLSSLLNSFSRGTEIHINPTKLT